MRTPRWFERRRVTSNAHVLAALILMLFGAAMAFLAVSPHAVAQPPAATTPPQPATGQLSPEELRLQEDWRISMAQVPLPKEGCFESSYPSKEWQEVPCVAPPNVPMPPKHGPPPFIVGNGSSISAQAPTGFISTAIGSFDSVTNVTSVRSPIANRGPAVANAYTLQLNTDFFSSTACRGAADPTACDGWEQFVYANNGSSGGAFIQYWLRFYNNPCPAGWNQISLNGSPDIYCWRNSAGAAAVPNQPITNLRQMSLSGGVSATGDSVTFATGGTAYATTGSNAVNAAAGWRIAEFNVFGYGGNEDGGGEAAFNSGADIVPRTRIMYGGNAPPVCVAQGFTAETNNLSFGPSAPGGSAPGPAVIFRESTAGGAMPNCAAASTVGDTHLATFGGLFYDFQASGDFVLAEVDPEFVVQTRQVSAAPTWPDASVNNAVATRMGRTRVALCLAAAGGASPATLYVDGATIEVADGNPISLPDGVDILRRGNVYLIRGPSGDSVRAVIHPTWIDVTVGLGRWPARVKGLLANAGNDINKIVARDGTMLTSPFSFDEFYHRYGESWRVPPGESLLSVCGERDVERGNPRRPFYAKNLDQAVYERTRAICTAAGVAAGPLLDACTLDVAVIGNDAAAKVFVGAAAPLAVGEIVATPGAGSFRLIMWLLLSVVLVVGAVLAWLLRRRTSP